MTRKRLIDPRLRSAGWRIVRFDPSKPLSSHDRCAIEEYPTDNGPADYALCIDGRILGIVEAKKLTLGPQNVLTQAERYSKGVTESPLHYGDYRVPFIYSTNGEIIWHQDVRNPSSRSRVVAEFHTPDALADKLAHDFNGALTRLQALPNDHPRIRPYQVEANAAIEQALAARKRQMLLAMATGTGKTFTMVNEIYRLMKTGMARRILFLVDRRALAAQAVLAFASFDAEPNQKFDKIYEVSSQPFHREDFDDEEKFNPNTFDFRRLERPKSGDAFVLVCTIQRMTINLFGRNALAGMGDEETDDDADKIAVPIHAFDLVIADECHRGYSVAEAAIWRKTLDHFDATKIGLTATPAAHTMGTFNEIIYRYEYERAVRETYLVDYDAVAIKSSVRMQGIFLKEGEQVGVVNPLSGARQLDLIEDEREFPSTEIEQKITSPDSNRKILAELKTWALQHEQLTGRFPKTLIFAANDVPHTSHADQLVDFARDTFGRGDSFVQKITGKADRPLQRIREFRNRTLPGVVVTVDMLSTGVDIPDLEYIVLLRPVKSRILFEQMLGRGTRRGERFPDKSHFTVFDCFDGTLLKYFKEATGITAEVPEVEVRTIAEIIEDIWTNRDRDYNTRRLVKRLQRIDKQMSAEARQSFSAFVEAGDLGRYAAELQLNLRKDFTSAMALLRDPRFQDLLVNYQRAPRTFLVAYETQDTVSSSWIIRGTDGKEYRPGDYLAAFSRFVRENPEKIDAIRILLNRPRRWNTEALTELRQKLATTPQRFSEETLRKAHEIHYQKALVDIISMVKHASNEQNPLLTADERVSRAFATVTRGKSFTPEQQQWLDRIKDHLVQNLTIEIDDFDSLPVFARAGGRSQAERAFSGELVRLIDQFNEAVAA